MELKPEDEDSARQLQVLAAITPMLARALPEESGELDRYLRTIAWGAASCRSDDAPPVGVFEWDGERWQRVELESGG
jgi:hypothetical protein